MADPYKLFIRDLEVIARIGACPHEREAPQKIIVNIELDVEMFDPAMPDELTQVVNYNEIVDKILARAKEDHINLLELYAEEIMGYCFFDKRILHATVKIDKPEAYTYMGTPGISLSRGREQDSS